MKKLIPALMLAALAPLAVLAQTSQGPIAQWKMGGNAGDSSGFNNHGTMNNVTPDTGRNGKPNSALLFNNATSYISVPYNSSFNVSQFSICATVKPKVFYSGNCQVNQIFQRGDYFASGAYGMIIYDNAYDGSCATMDTNKEVFAGNVSTNMNAASEPSWQYAPTAHTNQWYSVVLTYDGTSGRVFVNGVPVSLIGINVPVGVSNTGITIGRNSTGSTAYPYNFNGLIDDITLYNRVLTLAEIKAYDTSTMPPKIVPPPPPPASVNELSTSDVRMYPNPAHNATTLHFPRVINDISYTAYNGLGQVISAMRSAGNKIEIATEGWPAGQYLLRVIADGTAMSKRLTVE